MDATGKTTHTTTHATHMATAHAAHMATAANEPAPAASTDRRYIADMGGTHNILEAQARLSALELIPTSEEVKAGCPQGQSLRLDLCA